MWDSDSNTITGKYSTLRIHLDENRMLCEETEHPGTWHTLIVAFVSAVVHNDDFIIAKQHPQRDGKTNFEKNNYHIIEVRSAEARASGACTKKAFEKLHNDVGAENTSFDQIYGHN